MDATRSMAQLSRIQIRYHVRYLTWFRLRSWSVSQKLSMSDACDHLLSLALDEVDVTSDPNKLLQLPLANDDR